MDIEKLKELKEQIRGSHDGINGDDLNLLYELLPLVDEAIEMLEKEISRNEMLYGAKLCPFCAGEATMRPEGDYWEITCDDCGVFKQGSTYEQALNEWNLRRL